MEGRKWEELNIDCLVNVFGRVGMESLLLDVPFVCKPWYKATLDPMCWEHLIFPDIKPCVYKYNNIPFIRRLMMEFEGQFSVNAFIKFVIDRSRRCATTLRLTFCCNLDTLEYAVNECPALKVLYLDDDEDYETCIQSYLILDSHKETLIPKLVSKLKNLEMLAFNRGHLYIEETLHQIGLYCNNFIKLEAPGIFICDAVATTIVASLPKLRYLVLKGANFIINGRENLMKISQGCKELVHLDVRNCIGFAENDAAILYISSHLPTFMCEGSTVTYSNYYWLMDDGEEYDFYHYL